MKYRSKVDPVLQYPLNKVNASNKLSGAYGHVRRRMSPLEKFIDKAFGGVESVLVKPFASRYKRLRSKSKKSKK